MGEDRSSARGGATSRPAAKGQSQLAAVKRSCGGVGRESHGEICQVTSGPGKPCSIDSTGGRRPAGGADSFMRCRPIAMMNGTASTARSTAPTSTPRAEKGGRRAGHRSLARRSIDHGSRRGRRTRTAAHVRDHRGPAARQSTRQGARCESAVDLSARRQGVRLGCVPSCARGAELRAGHPVQRQPRAETAYDKERYKARSEIECTFALLKQARRLQLGTRRRGASTRPSSRSAALCCG